MRYLAILALLPFAAYATDKPPEPKPAATATSQSSSVSSSQSASNAASEASNNLTVEDRRQAPAVLAPSIAPTAPCYYSVGGGLSVPGFGASGGKAILDKDCETRERARLFFQFGFTDMAVSLLCGDTPNCPYPNGKPVPEKAQCDEKVERVLQACVSK